MKKTVFLLIGIMSVATSCQFAQTPTFLPLPGHSWFSGKAFLDANNNGQIDSADTPLQRALFIARDARSVVPVGKPLAGSYSAFLGVTVWACEHRRDDRQIIGDYTPAQPTFHPGLAAIETTIQSASAPQVTDATFDP